MSFVIEAENIVHSYGKYQSLKGLSLKVEEASIFALLGPNGAGKTTFVKAVLDLTRAKEGSILLNGMDTKNEQARNSVAYLPEKFNFFPYYSIENVVRFYGKMQGVKGSELEQQMENSLKRLKIWELKEKKLSELSKGQIQRAGIASMLMGDNKLLILDEPFSGLDPIGIKELKDLLKELKNEGKTLFINSHILSEMEQICDHVAILNEGVCLAQGELKSLIGNDSLEDFFYKKVQS